MANEVPAQYSGDVTAELQALIARVRGEIEQAVRAVYDSQSEMNAPLDTLSRLRLSSVVTTGVLIGRLAVPRLLNSVLLQLVDRGIDAKQEEVVDDQVRGESVDGPARLLVEELGVPAGLASQVWEVVQAYVKMMCRHTHGSRGLVELVKQIIVASVTMPQTFEYAFQTSRFLDVGSSIDRRALAGSLDDLVSSRGVGYVSDLFLEPQSLWKKQARRAGYDSVEDYRRAKRIEHNQQLDVLALDKDLREAFELDPDCAEDSSYEHLAEVMQRDWNQSLVDQAGRLVGHEGGAITAAGMFSMGISERDSYRAYITPKSVACLMVELANPAPGERIYDPCFGMGEILVAAARGYSGLNVGEKPPSLDAQRPAIFGVERDILPYATGLSRLMLADVDYSSLRYDDALNPADPLPYAGADSGFECIVTAPPWGRRELSGTQFPLPSGSIENQFLQHVMGSLRLGGRAVVALPEAILFRAEDRPVRKALLSDYRVDGVVSLPAGAFEPCTNLPMSLLMFSRLAPREKVRFARVSPQAWEATAMDDAGRGDSPGLPEAGVFGGEMFRQISSLFGYREEKSADAGAPGVEAWDVPLRELENRDYELIANKSGNEALESELARLVAAEPSLGIERLEHVADVKGGLSYKLRFRSKPGDSPDVIAGLVYSGDVTEHGIRTPTWFLSRDGIKMVKESAFLRGGDLVVRTAGTVGNIGLVESGMITMLPATGVAQIRVHNGIDPRFLVALLSSPVYRNWLSGHARGPTRRLSLRKLRTLKVPVPSLSVQGAVVEEVREPRADALAALFRLMAETVKSPIVSWLETPVAARLAVGSTVGSAGGIDTLVEVAQGIQSLAVSESSDRSIRAWLEAAGKAAAALDGVDSIPPGAGRLATLEFALVRLHGALGALGDADGHVIERLRSVTRVLIELAEHEVYMMQRSITLDLDVKPVEVVAGDASEVIVRATNASAVPLRNVRLMARRPDGTVEERAADYVAERGTHDLPIEIRPTGKERSLQIAVEWQARRFDGKSVGDDGAVTLLVRENRAQYGTGVEAGDLGSSPYIVGSPVERREMFFGRTDVMERIKRQLGTSTHANVILLEGNRRTGKTSILRQIQKDDVVLRDWIPVDCSLQAASGDDTSDQRKIGIPTPEFFRLIARKTGRQLFAAGVETWFPDLPDRDAKQPFRTAFRNALRQAFASSEYSFETLEHYLEAAVNAAMPRRILLMFDEFDALQEGIEAGVTSPLTPSNIRYLLQKNESGISAIIAGSRRLKKLRENYWSALFGLGHPIGISKLPIDSAKLLVTKPVDGKLRYLPQACDRLVELCACHPFLVQSLCSRVFDRAVTGSGRTITRDIVEQAATDMVRDSEHLRTLWDYARTERRRLMLALCEQFAGGPDAVNLRLLEVKLHENGVPIHRSQELADDLEELIELELLDLGDSSRGVTYRLPVPLMAMWIRKNVDFDGLVIRAREEAEANR